MLGSIINYFTRGTLAVASAAVQHDPAITSEQLALHRQVAHP